MTQQICVKFSICKNKLKINKEGDDNPTHEEVAQQAMVLKSFVTKIMKEYKENSFLADTKQKLVQERPYKKLNGETSIFLLALRVEDDCHYLKEYKLILYKERRV